MLHYFVKWVIGGQTGKRESAWFAFFMWLPFSIWLGYVDFATEREIDFLQTMWNVLTPFVLGWLGTAHGLDWASKQTTLGGPREFDADYLRQTLQVHPRTRTAVYEVFSDDPAFNVGQVG